MCFRPTQLILICIAIACGAAACRSRSASAQSSSSEMMKRDAAGPSPANLDSSVEHLCAGRERCRTEVVGVVSETQVKLVRVLLAPRPDASEDVGRCARREYWVTEPLTLVAVDCETQWGADNLGPAQIQLRSGKMTIAYEEFQASDRCERVDALLRLSPLSVLHQSRRTGVVRRDRCKPTGRGVLDPRGDGRLTPLVLLHRE